eukprot:scaffold312794_cov35-Prasinocladus_malaysianus.AAC.1
MTSQHGATQGTTWRSSGSCASRVRWTRPAPWSRTPATPRLPSTWVGRWRHRATSRRLSCFTAVPSGSAT